MNEDNIAVVKRGYEAFSKGDFETLRTLAAEKEVWTTVLGAAPGFEDEYHGPDGVNGFFARLQEVTGGTFRDVPEAFVNVDDHRVAVLDHITAKRDGHSLDHRVVHIFEVRDGKIERVSEFTDNPRLVADFYS